MNWSCWRLRDSIRASRSSLDREPAFVDALRRRALERGLADRVSFPGTATGGNLDRAYDAADVMVLASRAETYGMVVTEALARGVPVITADVGGVAEAHIDRGGVRDQPDPPAAEASKTLGGEEIETGADAGGHDVDSR